MRKFFIEISYWAAYFMKWKSEKEIIFSNGVGFTILMLLLNLMTLLFIVQLYTPFAAVEGLLSIIPEGVLTKENKWPLVFALLPIGLFVEWLIVQAIYRKSSRKKLFRHFKNMPPQRQVKGKTMFISYSLLSVVVLFIFLSIYTQRMFPEKNEVSPERKKRIESMLQKLNDGNPEDTISFPKN